MKWSRFGSRCAIALTVAMTASFSVGQSPPPTPATSEPVADVVPQIPYGRGQVALSFDPAAKPGGSGGGGIVGKINEVTGEITGAGSSSKASVTIQIDAFVHERVGSPWRVSLKVGQPDVRIPAQIPGETSAALRRELALFADLLGVWEVNLDDAATVALKLKGACEVVVDRPFASLKQWKGSPVTIRLSRSAVPEVASIRLFVVGPQGLVESERVPRGVPVVVEVLFNRPPNEGEHLIELSAGKGLVKVVAQRVDQNATRFMTPMFVVSDNAGLPAMTPAAPTSGPNGGEGER